MTTPESLTDHIRWVLDHEIRPMCAPGPVRTYPAQVAMLVGRHFGTAGAEPSVTDTAAALDAMGFASEPFTFKVRGRESVTVPMYRIGGAS